MGKAKTVADLKSRQAEKRGHTCSFCGQHRNDVPLMITSNITGANICSFCALTVVQQTFAAGQQVFEANEQLKKERWLLAKKLDELTGEQDPGIIMPEQRKQNAVDKANAAEVDDG